MALLGGDAASLLFTIKADTDQARTDFKKLRGEIMETTQVAGGSAVSGFEKLGSTLSGLAGPATIAAAGLASIGTAAAAGIAQLFQLSKEAADFGSAIFDASQKTGLGAEALSALKFAADQSGSSFEQVTKAIGFFGTEIGKANAGNDEAAKKMKTLGVTSTDLEKALEQVFRRIADGKNDTDRLALAAEAFGSKLGRDLIPLIKDADGDFRGLIDRAKELGVTIDDEAMRAADEFGDQLDLLNAQFEGISRTIGQVFMKDFLRMAQATSEWAVKNKGEIELWAHGFSIAIEAAIAKIGALIKEAERWRAFSSYVWWITQPADILGKSTGLFDEMGKLAEERKRAEEAAKNFHIDPKTFTLQPGPAPKSLPEGSDLPAGSRSGTQKRPPTENDREFRKFFEDLGFHVNRTFGEAINKGSLHPSGMAADIKTQGEKIADIFALTAKALEKGYRLVDERVQQPGVQSKGPHQHYERGGRLRASMFGPAELYGGEDQLSYLKMLDAERLGKASGSTAFDKFKKDRAEDFKKFNDQELQDAQRVLDDWIAEEENAASERLKIRQNEANLAKEILKGQLDEGLISEQEYVDRVGQMKIDMLQEERDEIAGQIGTRERIQRLAELDVEIVTAKEEKENSILKILREQSKEYEEQIKKLRKANPRPVNLPRRDDEPKDFFGGLFGSIGKEKFENQAEMMASTMKRLGAIAGDAIKEFAQGVGSLVENWVLLGDAADGGMKKLVASVLAGVAAQAAVMAVMETAYGIAALTPWGAAIYGPAPFHFKSAALFATVAVGTALAGRAVAGDSFQTGAKAMARENSGAFGSARSGGGIRPADEDPARDPNDLTSPLSKEAFVRGRPKLPWNERFEQLFNDIVERQQAANAELAGAINTFNRKFGTASPGEVVMAGIKNGKVQDGLVEATHSSYRRGGSLSERLARSTGEVR